jgi:hypothetical protein
MIRDNPFLCAAFLAGISLAALESDIGSASFFGLMWTVLGFGFHLTATLPQKLMPGLSPPLAIAMGIALGLIPYLVADIVWRTIRNR